MDIKQKLELGYVLEVEIREIRELTPLFFDSFVFLSNLRFKSQSDVILTGSLRLIISTISQVLNFFPFILRCINVKIGITLTNLFLANP